MDCVSVTSVLTYPLVYRFKLFQIVTINTELFTHRAGVVCELSFRHLRHLGDSHLSLPGGVENIFATFEFSRVVLLSFLFFLV